MVGAFYFRIQLKRDRNMLLLLIKSKEAESKNLAEKLHEDMGPRLSALKLRLDVLNHEKDESKRMEIVEIANNEMDSIIKEVRTLVRFMAVNYTSEKGLYEQLLDFKNHIEKNTGIIINLNLNNINKVISKEDELSVFKLTQAVINYACYYLACNSVSIDSSFQNGKLKINFIASGNNNKLISIKDEMLLSTMMLQIKKHNLNIQSSGNQPGSFNCFVEFNIIK